jgi:hypothetical protein
VGPVICAIGRAENHALLRFHANALGVGYIALDGEDARLIINGKLKLHSIIQEVFPEYDRHRPPILTTIDSSTRPESMRSLIATSQKTFQLPLSLQGNLDLLETFESPQSPRSLEELEQLKQLEEFDSRYAITLVRSPHGQISLWPVIEISHDGALTPVDEGRTTPALDSLLQEVQSFAVERKLVGALTFVASKDGAILLREWGLTPLSLWSEHACHTTVAEQLVRAFVDLPLGQTQIITENERYLEEVVDLIEHSRTLSERLGKERRNLAQLLDDPTRPFLHLFARNPKLKVSYEDQARHRVKIAVYADSEAKAKEELEHAKDFMAGFDL